VLSYQPRVLEAGVWRGGASIFMRGHLHPKISLGGFVILDDYGAMPACRAAVDDYRRAAGVRDAIDAIDGSAVYWQRPTAAAGTPDSRDLAPGGRRRAR